jgi:hypothetical protein
MTLETITSAAFMTGTPVSYHFLEASGESGRVAYQHECENDNAHNIDA